MSSIEEKGYERELKIMKEAKHPFIIEYIEEFLCKNNKLCIVTKLASGGDFEKFIKEKKTFTEEEALEFFTMILLALDFLHSKSICHRDLKPANIFIDKLDYGK
jgi:serine/threonine protein kinase